MPEPRTISKRRLQDVLTRRLKLDAPRFRLERFGSMLGGSIISDTFRGKRDVARQRMIWDALEEELIPATLRTVGTLLAYTPEEWDIDSVASNPGVRPRASSRGTRRLAARS